MIVTAVVQQSLMEPRNPPGKLGAPLRSQVRDENPRDTRGLRAHTSSVIRDGAIKFDLVGDAGVVGGAINAVAGGGWFGG